MKREPTLYDWFDEDGNVIDRCLSFADARFIYGGVAGKTRRLSVVYKDTLGLTDEQIIASSVTHDA